MNSYTIIRNPIMNATHNYNKICEIYMFILFIIIVVYYYYLILFLEKDIIIRDDVLLLLSLLLVYLHPAACTRPANTAPQPSPEIVTATPALMMRRPKAATALAAVCASIVWSPLLREWRCDHCTVPASRRGHVATRCVQLCLFLYGVVQRTLSHQRAIVRDAPVLFETRQQCRRSQLKDRW